MRINCLFPAHNGFVGGVQDTDIFQQWDKSGLWLNWAQTTEVLLTEILSAQTPAKEWKR